jgi:deazaflavin-dependent oxidoreductase (nitroreductase family)
MAARIHREAVRAGDTVEARIVEEVQRMVKWSVRLVGAVLLGVAMLGAVFVGGMRARHPAVTDRVRRFNRAVTNPRMLRTAGQLGASVAVVRHVGRSSGRSYDTPVTPFPIGDEFVIALPYGPETDWVRNVLKSGSAELVHDGRSLRVEDPRLVSVAEVGTHLPSSEQRTLRLFGVTECLRVRRSGE